MRLMLGRAPQLEAHKGHETRVYLPPTPAEIAALWTFTLEEPPMLKYNKRKIQQPI